VTHETYEATLKRKASKPTKIKDHHLQKQTAWRNSRGQRGESPLPASPMLKPGSHLRLMQLAGSLLYISSKPTHDPIQKIQILHHFILSDLHHFILSDHSPVDDTIKTTIRLQILACDDVPKHEKILN